MSSLKPLFFFMVALAGLLSVSILAEEIRTTSASPAADDTSRFGQTVCTEEYSPVCGVNGITYGNRCKAKVNGVSIAYEGACRGVAMDAEKCSLLATAEEKAACLRKLGADPASTSPDMMFQKCRLIQDDELREKCVAGLKENVRDAMPALMLRKCMMLTDDAARAKCRAEITAPAAVNLKERCEKFTDADDRMKCLVALKEGVEEAFDAKDAAYACVKKFGSDEEGKVACIRKLHSEIQQIRVDCSVFDSTEAQEKCNACAALDSPSEKASCLFTLRQCREVSVDGDDKPLVRACIMKLEKDDQRENRCKNLESASLKEACLKTEFGLHNLKRCDTKNGTEKRQCLNETRDNVTDYVKFNFRRILSAIEKLGSEGYLTAEELADIKAYIQTKQQEFEAAATPEEKKAIVREVMEKWKDFKERQIKEFHLQLLKKRVAVIQRHLDKLKELSADLKEAGKDTARMDSAISKAEERLNKVKEATTIREAAWRLKNLELWLQHVKRIINYMRENRPLAELTEPVDAPQPAEPTPTITPSPAAA